MTLLDGDRGPEYSAGQYKVPDISLVPGPKSLERSRAIESLLLEWRRQ
jgi:hypothetical protein